MKIQPSICLDDWGKPRKKPSQVGRHRDSNPGPPECEFRALPRIHLARCYTQFWFLIFREKGTGSYRTYLSLVKLQPRFLSLQWKTCLWAELKRWCLSLQWRTCPWAEDSDDILIIFGGFISLLKCWWAHPIKSATSRHCSLITKCWYSIHWGNVLVRLVSRNPVFIEFCELKNGSLTFRDLSMH